MSIGKLIVRVWVVLFVGLLLTVPINIFGYVIFEAAFYGCSLSFWRVNADTTPLGFEPITS